MRRSAFLPLLAVCALPAPPREPVTPEGPAAVVAGLQEAVLAAAARDGVALAARAERLAPAVRAAFDLEGAARTVAGGLWEEAPPERRAALVGALERLAATSLAARVPFDEKLRFAALEVAGEDAGSARVTGAVVERDDSETALEYRLVRAEGAWRVSDVAIDGKSGLERLTKELAPAREAGLAELTGALEQRVRRFTETPQAVTARLQEALVAAMKGGAELGYAARLALLAPVVEDTHDLAAMARLSVGRTWSKLSAAERRTFSEAFRELSLAAYAANFDKWNGERFAVDEAQKLERAVVVQGRLIKSGGKVVSFHYLFSLRGGLWRIVNVIVDGVSDLALKRTEYSGLYDKSGFDGLLAKVRAETARYRGGERD